MGGAGLHTGAATCTGGHIDHEGVGDGVWDRQVDSFARREAGIESVGNFHRAYRHTGAAADTKIRINPGRFLPECYLEFTRFARHRREFSGQQHFNVFMEETFTQTVL